MLVHLYRAHAPHGARRSHVAAKAFAAIALVAGPAACLPHVFAQCQPTWQSGDGVPGVLTPIHVTSTAHSVVEGLATWDPDGSGPAEAVLVAGGLFEAAGSAIVKNIAAWNGSAWSPMGMAEDWVSDVLVHNGELYISLREPTPTTNSTLPFVHRVLRWNGVGWQAVGIIGQSHYVYDLHTHNGELYAGGRFVSCGGVNVYSVARWDGSAWHAVGKGIASTKNASATGIVHTLATLNGDLIAAGEFQIKDGFAGNSIVRFDGENWVPMGEGFEGAIHALVVHQGKLVAGGQFFNPASKIAGLASWDGTAWQQEGLKSVNNVRGLHVHHGLLMVGGEFLTDNPVVVKAWDGEQWTQLGGGLRGDWVAAMVEYQGQLVAGGAVRYATKDGKPLITSGLASLDAQLDQWRSLPSVDLYTYGEPEAAVEWNGGLAIAGSFANTSNANGARVRHWTGGPASASAILGTEPFSSSGPTVLVVHEGQLLAGKASLYINGQYMTGVARWTGQTWEQVGDDLGGISDVLSNDGMLIAAGNLYSAQGGFPYGAAYFDGIKWLPLGDGMPGVDGVCLAAHQGEPVVHYSIGLSSSSYQAKGVARFDGAAWQALGPTSSPQTDEWWLLSCWNMLSWKGSLLAVGDFKLGGASWSVVRWSGDAWVPVLPYISGFRDLYIVGDRLFAQVYKGQGQHLIHEVVGNELVPFKDVRTASGSRLASHGHDLVLLGPLVGTDGALAMNWAHLACLCPADCDGSSTVDVDDFVCFHTAFVQGTTKADCDASGTLTIDDFVCFQTAFVLGC